MVAIIFVMGCFFLLFSLLYSFHYHKITKLVLLLIAG